MKADAILTSDMHLRQTAPEARTDNYFSAQARKLAFIRDLQKKHDCPIFDAGDMFNTWKPGEFMCQWAIKNLPDRIITIPGNHDIPNHNLDLYDKSGLAVLEAAGKVEVRREGEFAQYVTGFPYGTSFKPGRGVALVHVYVATSLPPNVEGYTPRELLDALPGYSLIISGHNHQPLVYRSGRRLLVNPGSLMRMFANQADMRPRVYLWYAKENEVEEVFLPIEKNVISRKHIEKVDERTARLDAFVSRLDGKVDIALSFEDNLEVFIIKNKIRENVVKEIRRAVDGE